MKTYTQYLIFNTKEKYDFIKEVYIDKVVGIAT